MTRLRPAATAAAVAVACAAAAPLRARVTAQPTAVDVSAFHALAWRSIGPFAGGRTDAGAGVPSDPRVFYIGVEDGGVWKSTDAGERWRPSLDREPAGTIGSIAVAPSAPSVVYAGGSGGLYKTTDAGGTWSRLAFPAGNDVARLAVDPADANVIFAAVEGDPYGANDARGVFRSTDGGRSFARVLFRDADTGGVDVAIDPANHATIYASLWATRRVPWLSVALDIPGGGVFKSTDDGTTWHPADTGLTPSGDRAPGRVTLATAAAKPGRIFALVESAGNDAAAQDYVYRSDDGGDTWTQLRARGLEANADDPADIVVDPADPNTVHVVGRALWTSTDGGDTFHGAPEPPAGGSYRHLWIDPANPDVRLVAGDHGANVTVDGGATWSSSFNQPTADFARVSTDTAFPYRVCGGFDAGGAVCVASRGRTGRITTRDWNRVGTTPGASVAADPNDADVIYSGHVTRFDRRTGTLTDVPLPDDDPGSQALPAAPLLFSPTDKRVLFFGGRALWTTMTAGETWTHASPNLSRPNAGVPESLGVFRSAPGATPDRLAAGIDAVRPSTIDGNVIWVGTDDGAIDLTRDGGAAWTDVTPPAVAGWSRVSSIEASHFDVASAYAAVDASGIDDARPHVYRTRDNGASWADITRGLPAGSPVHVVIEDSLRRGLLFAGTDDSVYVSFDDGDSWQSLALNLPVTSVRDLTIRDADLIAATRGRGFWVLDDFTPLRQVTGDVLRADAFLFRPATAWRARWGHADDPPLTGDPTAPNPPDGIAIDYALGAQAAGPITLEIVDGPTGEVLRRYSSDDPISAAAGSPTFTSLSSAPGVHRLFWDLRDVPLPSPSADRAPAASADALGVLVPPGVYQIRLTVGGRVLRQAVVVQMDPAIRTSDADLARQFRVSKAVATALVAVRDARDEADRRVASTSGGAAPASADRAALDESAATLTSLLDRLQRPDVAPAAALEAAANAAVARATALTSASR